MKTIFLILALGILKTQAAVAVPTLVYTFQPQATFKSCASVGRTGGQQCVDRRCSEFGPEKSPLNCFSTSYVEMTSHSELNVVKQSYDTQMAALINQVQAYKDQIASTHKDLADTIISDPQFRTLLIKKIKEETNNQ